MTLLKQKFEHYKSVQGVKYGVEELILLMRFPHQSVLFYSDDSKPQSLNQLHRPPRRHSRNSQNATLRCLKFLKGLMTPSNVIVCSSNAIFKYDFLRQIVFRRPFVKRFALCYRTVVCSTVCPVCLSCLLRWCIVPNG